jgi:hypothetical protein
MVKGIHKSPTVNTILEGEIQKAFCQKWDLGKKVCSYALITSTKGNKTRKRNKRHTDHSGSTLCLCTDDMIDYIKMSKQSTKQLVS